MSTQIHVDGRLQSVSKCGQKAQIVVPHGAYKGTYHAQYQGSDAKGSTLKQLWFTKPNKRTGDQLAIITETEI